jgi:pyruvate/2-oxoglutarate dehydrogenase complex dihydrolipoamide acyltransferase (E2) component
MSKNCRDLLEFEPDKVNVEIAAPDNRVLKEIKTHPGGFVNFSAPIAVIEKAG